MSSTRTSKFKNHATHQFTGKPADQFGLQKGVPVFHQGMNHNWENFIS